MEATTPSPPVPTATETSGGNGDIAGVDGPAPSNTSAKPVAGTSTRRIYRQTNRRRGGVAGPSPGFKKDVAVLKASGMTIAGIAKTLDISRVNAQRIQALPEVRADVAELRLAWKGVAQAQVTTLAEGAWNMASSFVEKRLSKDFDNTLRGLAAMEKISASVSGEGQKVEITGLPQPPQVELNVLIGQLFGSRRA